MLSATSLLFTLLLSTSILIHAQEENGPCVTSCFSSNPKSSFCDGNEQGDALDQCTCNTYSPTGDPQISCIQACPEDQQLIFANNLPDLCNSLLFPNLDLSDDASSSATAENTASSAPGPQETATGSTTSGSGTASATGTAASGTASATGTPDNAAGALGLPLGVIGYVAYAAVMAGWL